MAAKSKKRLSKIENKLLKLDKLQLNDVICSICQSILIEPVTLPCYHDFCHGCFNGSVENNALCCPLCRLRIGSWLRTTAKQNNLVNTQLWEFIKSKFPHEISVKLKGDDINIPEDKPALRLSAPGEIRLEYEAELKRLREERVQIEQKHQKETEQLVKKIQTEEEEAHKKYLERIEGDERLAKQIQLNTSQEISSSSTSTRKQNTRIAAIKSRIKTNKIENYLCKRSPPIAKESPKVQDDNTSTDSSTPKSAPDKSQASASPEVAPSYTKYLKNIIDKKFKNDSGVWNKENGDTTPKVISNDEEPSKPKVEEEEPKCKTVKPTKTIHSLPVSLPYTGILQHKRNLLERKDTGSADSMRQELCYFKPIEGTTPTSYKAGCGLPLRVAARRPLAAVAGEPLPAPARGQLLAELCRLRSLSLAARLPSAFVLAIEVLRVSTEGHPIKLPPRTKASVKKYSPSSPVCASPSPSPPAPPPPPLDGIAKLHSDSTLRRTRSMGSIPKSVNETTPKKSKIKNRKVSSERKRYLRSDSKKFNATLSLTSPPLVPDPVNNNKISLVMKKLSSPLEKCDVKLILEEQLRIERLIEQEKQDLALARRVDAELNGRQLRRAAGKRPAPLAHPLRANKKLKV
ncbi:uncharacterized protein LOC105389694 [Plutella xylostella]|uniref:uncharacterized protein LOC105389694 n=1 Tax=Plutella xylostella TaxID=51655 RepID=UPI002032C381|nr:uncharacterized protein LOC105389694 [Plutella xylostella]